MPLDPFSAQIVALVRRMPDEAILALVRNQLDAISALSGPVARAARGRAAIGKGGRPVRADAKRAKSRHRIDSAERERLLTSIEKIVKASSGLSASEVAKAAGEQQTRVASALKELKIGKRIFQGGDRRFARYAGDPKTAEQASLAARTNASGPTRTPKRKKKSKA